MSMRASACVPIGSASNIVAADSSTPIQLHVSLLLTSAVLVQMAAVR
jgi:hypothetical protein